MRGTKVPQPAPTTEKPEAPPAPPRKRGGYTFHLSTEPLTSEAIEEAAARDLKAMIAHSVYLNIMSQFMWPVVPGAEDDT